MAARKQDESKVVEPSLWERMERPASAPRASLSLERIAAVAVEIADEEGAAAVTMRRLATKLGVAPMAAYRHVAGKDDLWALMVDRVSRQLAAPDDAASWREVLRSFALQTRELMLAHPWMGSIPLISLTPSRMAVAERQLAALAACDLDADSMMAAFRTVNSYVHGSTQAEIVLREYQERHGWAGGDETRQALAPQMNYLMSTGRYPTYERYGAEAARKDDHTWAFEFGLDCVLGGIAERLGI
ncbi:MULTISPECIES: TetR/AcrR family transcriptional regulator [unclassified Streptomyces]|uniref:TetR/AcrR family transcriptional regulator n=1 Tax=unclassified Streptomyces TaxID=2593676 RepID=UPI00224F6E68|nr:MULTISPECIES: TetR/AcrR family transcriptional regulator C-terminal domain-containing protein [unclassified Streptomyces]MCX5336348.1 TetR/AcrR family transcriptional regulator C-terminal domain-containing protein [Streptomyces sp. NBC_00140]MCX5367069.1 TetR/AcrR family transcriptional regulator C-terminal domain-containing protein [Streptomyces sp. NBC_00124]